MGVLRLSTKDGTSSLESPSAMVILAVTFPYSPEDRAFSEELAARVNEFRAIVKDYCLSFTSDELRSKREDEIKADLLESFNRVLRLGKIQTLYFNDFMIID